MLYKKNVFARRKGLSMASECELKAIKVAVQGRRLVRFLMSFKRMKKASTNELVIPLTAGFLYWLKLNRGMAKTMLVDNSEAVNQKASQVKRLERENERQLFAQMYE